MTKLYTLAVDGSASRCRCDGFMIDVYGLQSPNSRSEISSVCFSTFDHQLAFIFALLLANPYIITYHKPKNKSLTQILPTIITTFTSQNHFDLQILLSPKIIYRIIISHYIITLYIVNFHNTKIHNAIIHYLK